MTTPQLDLAEEYKKTVVDRLERIKTLADKTFAHLDDSDFYEVLDPESNSLEMLIKHMHGNMFSYWTDFLTSDGDKPSRDRDGEFEASHFSREKLLGLWEQGWDTLFSTLRELSSEDLLRTVYIRGEAHTVVQAIERQIFHNGYHVGQMVFLGKHLKYEAWQTLSIARGQSRSYRASGPLA
jgi:hypothetical protein